VLHLAHGVGRVYESPIPVSYYLAGAAATVLASFLIRAFTTEERPHPNRSVAGPAAGRRVLSAVAAYFLAVLGLVVVFSFIYPDQTGLGIAPLTFWIGLIIVPLVLCATVAGIWPAASPFMTIEGLFGHDADTEREQRGPAPWWVAPLLVYGLFWFELISGKGFDPISILVVVLVYAAYVLGLQRANPWPREEADPLGILFGFAQRMAPLHVTESGLRYRGFVAGLDEERPMPWGLFLGVFVLLASTTLDNLRETVQWFSFQQALGVDTWNAQILDSVALVALTLPFFIPFMACALLARAWMTAPARVMDTARMFGWSLIPIGIAYVLAHNMPLIIVGLPELIQQLAQGFGSDFLRGYSASPLLVWIIEIALIVGGHVIGVLTAHRAAVRIAGSHARALKSHVALTILMSLFTISTLWLLSLPIVVT
jgi:hypothetical protein